MSAAGWTMRYAEAEDAAALAGLEMAEAGGADVEGRAAHWESEILSPTNVLIAEDGDAIVGFVACGPEREEVAGEPGPAGDEDYTGPDVGGFERPYEVYALHVDPARRHQGIGTALVGAAIALGQRAGAREIVFWVETNAPARWFCERLGLKADLRAAARPAPHTLAPEIRYSAALEPMEDASGKADWRLLQPAERESKPESWPGRVAGGLGLVLVLGVIALWMFPALRARLAALDSHRQMLDSPVDQARRAAEHEVQILLRPLDHAGNIGGDPSQRNWRLGLAYGRLALIEERAGDLRKRDRYFEFARRALEESGVREPTESYIRARLAATAVPAR